MQCVQPRGPYYLGGYSIGGERLRELEVPSTLLTSRDDPVCPESDLDLLPENRNNPGASILTPGEDGLFNTTPLPDLSCRAMEVFRK